MVIGYLLDDTLDVTDGVQQAMIAIAEQMRARGHDVHYIVPYTTREDLQNVHSIGSFWSMKFNGNSVRTPKPANKKAITQLFADIQFDVLHVQVPYSPFFAAKVINLTPPFTKIFATFHILPYNRVAKIGTKLLGFALKKSNKRINKPYAVSEPAAQFMHTHFGLEGTVLPNPVNYSFFAQAKPRKNDKLSVVFVGRFDERKGVKKLVDAYRLLDEEVRQQITLTMCGKGPLHDEIVHTVQQEKLSINLPGFVSEQEKAAFLAGSDIAIFPSISGESFGIVLIEAMAAGAGITIGGNNPGYASVLHPWKETLFNPNDSTEIATTLTCFIKDEKRRHTIGSQQHTYVKQFDIEIVTDKLESEYKNTEVAQ